MAAWQAARMDDDSKQAWMKVGLHFAAAGDKLRTHAKAVGDEVKAAPTTPIRPRSSTR